MNNKVLVALALSVGLCAISMLAYPHHGTNISYDHSELISVEGVVTTFLWQNPHSQLFWEAKDANGNVVRWGAEMRAPGNLRANGYTRQFLMEKLAPGTEITVRGNPARSGAPVLHLLDATLPDGYCVCDAGGASEAPEN